MILAVYVLLKCLLAKRFLHCSWTCALTTKSKTNFLIGTSFFFSFFTSKGTKKTIYRGSKVHIFCCCITNIEFSFISLAHMRMLVLCSLTFSCADGSIPVLDLQPVWEWEKSGGYPSVIFALATALLVIMLLFYQDKNSSVISFRKQPGRKNIPITSLCSQRLRR